MIREMDPVQLSLPFSVRGSDGHVDVAVWRSANPESIGCQDWERDFPVCEAKISCEARGYSALMGWIQLVRMRSPINGEAHWVTDPLQVYDGLNTPFGFYGLAPTLFDAPARSDRTRSLDWYAESYLCFAPSSPMAREAQPLTAFSWGFQLDEGAITVHAPAPVALTSWATHVPLLESGYPGWNFGQASGR